MTSSFVGDSKLIKSISENNGLIESLSVWMWNNSWVKARGISDDGGGAYSLEAMLKDLPRDSLNNALAARRDGAVKLDLYAFGDLASEQREVVPVIAEYLRSSGVDIGLEEQETICRSIWNRIRMRVKTLTLLELAGAAKPSDCRFARHCNSCSDACPRLRANPEAAMPLTVEAPLSFNN